MKSTITQVKMLELLLDEVEAFQLINLLEGKVNQSDFKQTLIWHLKTLLKNVSDQE
jgi:hypothetical protein